MLGITTNLDIFWLSNAVETEISKCEEKEEESVHGRHLVFMEASKRYGPCLTNPLGHCQQLGA
jgi:hypothetical protein